MAAVGSEALGSRKQGEVWDSSNQSACVCLGKGLLSALSVGADAIAMGTRMAVTHESPLHSVVKQTVTEKNAAETIFTKNFDGLPARIMKTPGGVQAAKRVS